MSKRKSVKKVEEKKTDKKTEEKPVVEGPSKLQGEIGKKYQLMVKILTSDPRYAKALAEVVSASLHDKLSKCLINLSFEIGGSLNIIRSLISLEYERKKNHPTTILRVNSIVSKMMGKYTKRVGTEYLKTLVGDLINELFELPDLTLEPNTNYLQGDKVEEQATNNLKALQGWCQKFLDKIISETMREQMPREIRSICYFLKFFGEKFQLDFNTTVLPLISGFIMLRYICPAITVPQTWGLTKAIPKGSVRTNLTYIARVLQKLANGEVFQVETPHLMPINKFLDQNRNTLNGYLKQLCVDPKQQEGKLPFGDLYKNISYEDIHSKLFNMEDLVFVHGLIYEFGFELIASLQKEVILTDNKRPISMVSLESDFLSLVHSLGPPVEKGGKAKVTPTKDDTKRKPSKVFGDKGKNESQKDKGEKDKGDKDTKEKGEVKVRETLKGKSKEEIEKGILTKSIESLLQHVKEFDLSKYEDARFFYFGKPTRTNIPTFYLILHRVDLSFLSNTDELTVYIYKTLWKHVNEPYLLMVDLSWLEMNDQLTAAIYSAVVNFTRLMKKEHASNCQAIYLIHPTHKSLKAIEDLLILIPENTRTKLVKTVYEWTDLADIIDPLKIWIPFVSKKFVPITFNVIKFSTKDKKQERLLKLTHSSILNIDSKNGTVHHEILLQNIQEIRSRNGATEIIIKFTPETQEEIEKRKGEYFLKPSKSNFTQTARYACYSENQRDIIIDSIFESGIRSVSLVHDQSFVVKKDEGGKLEKRVLKFTIDSILNFKDKSIKREIPYSTIKSFYIDDDNKSVMYIFYSDKGSKKKYILHHDNTEAIRDSLLDAILRFKYYVIAEKELYASKDVDSVMDRFFTAGTSKSEETYDEKKWKQVLRIDHPCKDLNKLFRKFQPDKNKRGSLAIDNVKSVLSKIKLNLNDEEIKHLTKKLDPKGIGFITFDDLVKRWVFLRKEKSLVDKKRKALEKKISRKEKLEKKKTAKEEKSISMRKSKGDKKNSKSKETKKE